MNLVVFELGVSNPFGTSQVKQLITVGSRDLPLYAIRPHLYKHLAPAGSLYLEVQDANERKIKVSETLAISAIGSGNYWHGYVRFLIDLSLKANTQYYLALRSTGYTYGASAFVGWCNDFDSTKVPRGYSTPSSVGVNAPLDLELWTRRKITKGAYP